MKTLFKLILIGVIAGLTYNYVDDRNINPGEEALSIYNYISGKIASIEDFKDEEQLHISNSTGDTRSAYEKWSSPTPVTQTSSSGERESSYNGLAETAVPEHGNSEVKDDLSDAIEFPVKEKPSRATPNFPSIDSYARNTPPSAEVSLDVLVKYLVIPAKNELEKARSLYTWVATHISYDDNGFNTGNYADCSAQGVFANRVSVCEGYSNLLAEMGTLAGLQSIAISGYSKGIGYRPGESFSHSNHAWNTIRADGRWILIDATWGAGFGKGVNGRLVSEMRFEDYWFDTMPEEFIFTHMPMDDKWQLLANPVSKYQFERMPVASSYFFKLGLNGDIYLPSILNGNISRLPDAYSTNGNITVLSVPLEGTIRSGRAIRLKVRSDNAEKIATSNNGKWIYFEKEGNVFTATVRPQRGDLDLMANYGEGDTNYHTFLEYRVE